MYLTPILLLVVNTATAFLTDISKQCFNNRNSVTYGPSQYKTILRSTWMDKNKKFTGDESNHQAKVTSDNKTFREAFRGTRVFVKNIPDHVTWQELKDHFRVAGEVIFASISQDKNGQPKGHGIVQFETINGAKKAIRIMRNYPIDDSQLYVREDVQEKKDGEVLSKVSPGGEKGFPTPPSKWKCADEDVLQSMSQEAYKSIRLMIKDRDKARYRRNYAVSDKIREDLKYEHDVFIDDRMKLWWVSDDAKRTSQTDPEEKGIGRHSPWKQISTTPENDAFVDPQTVENLLRKRDKARRKKDFVTADALLEEARTCPDNNLCLLIYDESRTWRIWTEDAPPQHVLWNNNEEEEGEGANMEIRDPVQREDVEEKYAEARSKVMPRGEMGSRNPRSKWKCADEEFIQNMSQEECKSIGFLIERRERSRSRRDYAVSDQMREELKEKHNVYLDDKMKLWWISSSEEQGSERWRNHSLWRQIPTTTENDACVDPETVDNLLQKRDKARQKKDFETADALFEEARTCPDNNLCLLINDDSRTWRIWTEKPLPKPIIWNDEEKGKGGDVESSDPPPKKGKSIADSCISLVAAHAPSKVEEIRQILKEFPDREEQIFEKLQQKYKY